MNKIKILASIFVGTLVYTSVSFFVGANGLMGYKQLEEQKKEISRQTNKIELINQELNLEYTALLKDYDVIAAYARKLDYVGQGEKLVKITGLKPYEAVLYDTGTALKHKACKALPEYLCKILGVVFFLLSYAFFVLIDIKNQSITKWNTQGRRYDYRQK